MTNSAELLELQGEIRDLSARLGDETGPFPAGGVDGFLSHFVFAVEIGSVERHLFTVSLNPAVQTVARSDPFTYGGTAANHRVQLPLPSSCTLPSELQESDFTIRPARFFTEGRQHIWLQILNLDAQGDSPIGRVRIILGQTLKEEYEEVFLPSLGLATSILEEGFPARFFFSPVGVIETPFGAFRTRPKILAASRITSIPPVAGAVQVQEIIPLDHVDELRAAAREGREPSEPTARIVALAHPIDAELHLPGDESFRAVENVIGR